MVCHEDAGGVCKIIRVKYACGGSAAGFVSPICIIALQLSKEEFPSNNFVVVRIEGLSINSHIDLCSTEAGYMCLIGTNLPWKSCFARFHESVTCSMIKHIHRRFNPLSDDPVEGSIPIG